MNDIKSRAVSFSVSLCVVSALLIFSKIVLVSIIFVGALAIVISIAMWEFYKMAEKKGVKPAYVLGIGGALCYLFTTYLALFFPSWNSVPQLILGVLLFLLFFQNLFCSKNALHKLSISYFGIIYIAISLTFILKINYFYSVDAPISGQWWLMYLLVVTKSTDLGAYFTGKLFGRKALAPMISPKKTIEGLIGGMACSLAASFLLIYLTPHVYEQFKIPWLFALLMSFILSIFGQFGDLAESLIKRDVGVKDSNRIKGSGGILDMVDSMIFVSPIFYLFLEYGNIL
ncbi:MAG: hypothetical protein S4CHLAM7_13740 [Chlamydiae bacterium]|nr:hypothetical protein [Chlamydiota bacterium]